jgi:hypothetical protein
LPVILTGPPESEDYWVAVDEFIAGTLGPAAQRRYDVVVGDPAAVARAMRDAMTSVREHRRAGRDAYYFNWRLHVERDFQVPFEPTHEAMAALSLTPDQSPHQLASGLRRLFSGIVAGNVKEAGIRAVESRGPFQVHADPALGAAIDALLRRFVEQRRMKLQGEYSPCYEILR